MKSIKIFGVCLVLLGLFTGVCVIIADRSVDVTSIETAYKHGVLMGLAIAKCGIGSILIQLFYKK